MKKAADFENAYATDPRDVLGLNEQCSRNTPRFIADRRCRQIGGDTLFDKADNPFPSMTEMIDLKKEKNFLGRLVGPLSWD